MRLRAMMRWHDEDGPDEKTAPRQGSPGEALEECLRRLMREAKEAELERRLTKDRPSPGRRKGRG
jgi:hypothetical protein